MNVKIIEGILIVVWLFSLVTAFGLIPTDMIGRVLAGIVSILCLVPMFFMVFEND